MFEMMLGGRKSNVGIVVGSEGPEVITGVPKGDFLGEVEAASFVTGDQLAAGIGLTEGTAISDAGWLKFIDTVDGRTKYVAKRPLRHTVSWDQIHAKGAVFGTRTVVIKGKTYKVRLLSGANTNPSTVANSPFDHPGTHGCEWNRLLYHVSAKPFRNASNNTLTSEGIATGDWASYAETDIGMALAYLSGAATYGGYQWCQETGNTPNTRVVRGAVGVSYLEQTTSSNASVNRGWRPVLELVE